MMYKYFKAGKDWDDWYGGLSCHLLRWPKLQVSNEVVHTPDHLVLEPTLKFTSIQYMH